MSSDFEIGGSNEAPNSEVTRLAERLRALGIDSDETEQVVAEAVLLFGEGRPEHEVEKIISDFYRIESEKIAEAEAEADKPVSE